MRSTSDSRTDSIRSNQDNLKTSKPLPLKQRTSSVDTRRDYTVQTWTSLLGLVKPREHFVTVDNFSIWRRHLAWAMENGGDLRSYMTQRYASNMVFMSLLLGAELNVLFNSAAVTTAMRKNLFAENFCTVEFWAGMTILVSVILTILSLISTFTAWGMVSSVSDSNAHCILRSSIGQYVGELPGRFIVTAVYSFLLWVSLFFFLLLPVGVWSILLVVMTVSLSIHVVTVFSAFGRVIMHTGAMGSQRIFEETEEKRLLPHSLHARLLEKAKEELENKTSITRQYRKKRSNNETEPVEATVDARPTHRPRTGSAVRFADSLWTSVPPREQASVPTPLSDIASHGDTEASVASSERPDLPKRPPRPTRAHTGQSDGSGVDPMGGSSHSLEEWLKAGHSDTVPKPGGDKPKLSRGRISPIGYETPYSPPRRQKDSPGRGFAPLPTTVPVDRNVSATSSIDGTSFDDDHLTEEQKFDLEYGDLLNPEQNGLKREDDDDDGEAQYDYNDIEGGTSEQQHLLAAPDLRESNYSSVGSSNGGATPRRR